MLILSIQKLFYHLLGCELDENALDSGLILGEVFDKKKNLVAIFLAHHPILYQRISILDSRGSIFIRDGRNVWKRIVRFSRTMDDKVLPIGYQYWPSEDVVVYSIDGEVFSIPIADIDSIDATLNRKYKNEW